MKLIVMGFIFTFSAFALDLRVTEAGITSTLKNFESVECDNVLRRLDDYRRYKDQLDNEIIRIGNDVSSVMNSWYYQLSQYEGRATQFPYGYFRNIRDSAYTSAENTRTFARGMDEENRALDDIMRVLPSCLR